MIDQVGVEATGTPIEPHKHEPRLRLLDAPRCIGTAWPTVLRVFPYKVDVFSGTSSRESPVTTSLSDDAVAILTYGRIRTS